jgi:hypothetical protein
MAFRLWPYYKVEARLFVAEVDPKGNKKHREGICEVGAYTSLHSPCKKSRDQRENAMKDLIDELRVLEARRLKASDEGRSVVAARNIVRVLTGDVVLEANRGTSVVEDGRDGKFVQRKK